MSLSALHKVVVSVGVAFGVVVAGALSGVQTNAAALLVARLLIVAVAAWTTTYLADWLVTAEPVRRRIGGDRWIDGTWINVVRRGADDRLTVGIVQFVADGAKTRYEGRNYSVDTAHYDGSFVTKASDSGYPEMHFVYSSTSEVEGGGTRVGGGLIRFFSTRGSGPPDRMTVWCNGSTEDQAHAIEGFRVLDDRDLELLEAEGGAGAIELARSRNLLPGTQQGSGPAGHEV